MSDNEQIKVHRPIVLLQQSARARECDNERVKGVVSGILKADWCWLWELTTSTKGTHLFYEELVTRSFCAIFQRNSCLPPEIAAI